MLSRQFISYNGMLYKRVPIGVHLRCVDKYEAQKLMEEIHEGVYGPHMNEMILAKNIARQDYVSLTIETDCRKFIKSVITIKHIVMLVTYPPWSFRE